MNGTGSILYIGWGQLCVEDRVCLESVGVHLNGIIFFFYKPGPTIIETYNIYTPSNHWQVGLVRRAVTLQVCDQYKKYLRKYVYYPDNHT